MKKLPLVIKSLFFFSLLAGILLFILSKNQQKLTFKPLLSTVTPKPSISTERINNFHIARTVVNIYREPSKKSETVTQGLYGEPVTILQKQGEWVKVSLPDQFNYQGWVNIAALANLPLTISQAKLKIIAVPNANILTKPSQTASVILSLPLGSVVTSQSTETQNNFIKVQLLDKKNGYILSKSLLDYSPQSHATVSDNQIIATAKQLLGRPYLWGGMTSYGLDCSGFVHTVFKVHSIRLHRDTDLQYLSDGIKVNLKDLQLGDLIFFETYKSGPSHVGIYLGNRQFIQAASAGVTLGSLNHQYYKKQFIGAKRVLK